MDKLTINNIRDKFEKEIEFHYKTAMEAAWNAVDCFNEDDRKQFDECSANAKEHMKMKIALADMKNTILYELENYKNND